MRLEALVVFVNHLVDVVRSILPIVGRSVAGFVQSQLNAIHLILEVVGLRGRLVRLALNISIGCIVFLMFLINILSIVVERGLGVGLAHVATVVALVVRKLQQVLMRGDIIVDHLPNLLVVSVLRQRVVVLNLGVEFAARILHYKLRFRVVLVLPDFAVDVFQLLCVLLGDGGDRVDGLVLSLI